MFWIASKLLFLWDEVTDFCEVKVYSWRNRKRFASMSSDALRQEALQILESQPASKEIHDAHEILQNLAQAGTQGGEKEER